MAISYEILQECGTTNERLRQIFTAKIQDGTPPEERAKLEDDVAMRKQLEYTICARIDDAIFNSLKHAHLMASVDLAWDSSTITRKTLPLVLYAQKRMSVESCTKALDEIGCKDTYIKRDQVTGKDYIDLPKFCDVNINLVRSIITRRTAAQSSRFSNLWPFFKYEARSTSEVSKLRADVLSQRSDIMADQFGYRALQVQAIRDMLLYGHCVLFPRSQWERDVEWSRVNVAEEFDPAPAEGDGKKKISKKARVKREGVAWIKPHPSRVFYDHAHPIHTINSDSGCEWFGFWDVVRYGDILDNPLYFNRDSIGFSPNHASAFNQYSSYFTQYYTNIVPPAVSGEVSQANDIKNNISLYTNDMRDAACFVTHFYWKLKPNQYRLGDYPYPVWLHLVVCNGKTVVGAEVMPSCPGAVFSYNESDNRLMNLSMAHELLPFQDQLTNLFTQLLETAKRDLFAVATLNTDVFPPGEKGQKALDEFRSSMQSENFYAKTTMLEVSFQKLRELGIEPSGTNIFNIIHAPPNQQLGVIFQAIAQTVQMAERIMSLSPQEQAQMSPRETSATEVQVIATTTESVYGFIADSIDEGRSAMKRFIYDALISLGSAEISTPVVGRYRLETVKAAGFDADLDGQVINTDTIRQPQNYTIIGTKEQLVGDYIFSSRDGAERSSNIQSAQALVGLMNVLANPMVMPMLTKANIADVVNTIIRSSGAGVDIAIEAPPGEENQPAAAPQLPEVSPEQLAMVSQGAQVPPTELPRV